MFKEHFSIILYIMATSPATSSAPISEIPKSNKKNYGLLIGLPIGIAIFIIMLIAFLILA
jgi:hypothetical protein